MEVVVGWWLFGLGFVFVLLGGFLTVRLFPDLLVMVVRGGDGVCVWVVAMGFGGWFLSPFSAVVADKMGCGGFVFTSVGMVVVGLGLPA
uniref:Uncharacterized protein n=1 Tax=Fagus sylvatica TaxID=28930 RepID=A0A2N9FV66_FAGSY